MYVGVILLSIVVRVWQRPSRVGVIHTAGGHKVLLPFPRILLDNTFRRSFPRLPLSVFLGVADTDGDGLVSVDDIVRNFRSHAHLDVVDGSREEEEVRREFLESFSGEQNRA